MKLVLGGDEDVCLEWRGGKGGGRGGGGGGGEEYIRMVSELFYPSWKPGTLHSVFKLLCRHVPFLKGSITLCPWPLGLNEWMMGTNMPHTCNLSVEHFVVSNLVTTLEV